MANNTINIVLADYDSKRLQSVMKKLQNHPTIRVVGISRDYDSLMEKIISMKPHAVFMDFSLMDVTAIGIAKEIERLSLDTYVFVISDNLSEDFKRDIKLKGITDVFTLNELKGISMEDFLLNYETKKEDIYLDTDYKQENAIILTYNTKGGVGKSTVAVNLAVALRQSPFLKHKKIALIDFDIAGANISTLCHVSDKKTMVKNLFYFGELPENIKMDDDDIETMMIKNEDGLMILPVPANYAYLSKIDFKLANRALKILKNHFDILVIDGAPNTSPTVDAALMYATHILLTTNTERQSVKQLMRFVDMLTIQPIKQGDYSYVLDKSYVVINHTQPRNQWGMEAIDISRTINRPLLREIPYSEYVKKALHGDSNLQAIDLANNGPFSIEFKRLANDICGAYPNTLDTDLKIGEKKKIAKEDRAKGNILSGIFNR